MNKNKLMYRHDGAQVEELTKYRVYSGFICSISDHTMCCMHHHLHSATAFLNGLIISYAQFGFTLLQKYHS